MNSTEQRTASASCSCVSFFARRRPAIRWPSLCWSTQCNYHPKEFLTTKLNYGSALSAIGTPLFTGGGFGVWREDMKKLLLDTRGRVFIPKTLDRLVECTGLKDFRTK